MEHEGHNGMPKMPVGEVPVNRQEPDSGWICDSASQRPDPASGNATETGR